MQFWLGLRVGGAYSAPPEPLSGFKGACTSKARDGRKNGREGQGRGRGGEAEEGKEEFCAVVTFPWKNPGVNRRFQAKRANIESFILPGIETTASITTKFCQIFCPAIKTTKYSSWVP